MKIKKRHFSAFMPDKSFVSCLLHFLFITWNLKLLQLLSLLLILFSTTNLLAQPANNSCASAIALNCNATITSNNQNASDDTLPTCGLIFPGQSVWYILIGTGTDITISTCNPGTGFDSQIGVYSGSCGALTCIVGNNNDSSCTEDTRDATVSWNSTANETYYIVVAGVGGAEGNFELNVECNPPSGNPPPTDPNVLCNTAIELTCFDEVITGNNSNGLALSLLECKSMFKFNN